MKPKPPMSMKPVDEDFPEDDSTPEALVEKYRAMSKVLLENRKPTTPEQSRVFDEMLAEAADLSTTRTLH